MENKCQLCEQSNTLKLLYKRNIDKSFFLQPYAISDSDYGKHMDMYKCSSCGIIYVDTSEISQLISNYYASMDDGEYEQDTAVRTEAFKRILKKLKTFKPHGKLLDIGCATGTFLNEAKKFGFDVYGLDPSEWAVNVAKQKYNLLNVSSGFIETANFDKNTFDVIVLTDVIEHVEKPESVINKVLELLKTGGILIIVTPDINSVLAKVLGEKWWHIRAAHLFYFSVESMTHLLGKSGFKVLKTRRYVWYLGLSYILKRLLKFISIKVDTNKLPKVLRNIPVYINLYDSMEIYAIKR